MRKLGTGEAATMDVRIRSKAGVDEKTAPAVYAAARKACAPFPNDAAAQLVLTEAAFDAGDYAGAEAAADRAIAADPGTVRAYTYKAQVRMALAEKAKDQSKETWTALRRFISTANKLDTEDPMPLLLFFESYVGAGIAPPKSAREALYYAFVLAPYDDGLRLSAAAAYLGEGNTASARELLVPLAADPHNRNLAEVATKMIAEIDAGNLKDARKDGETARHDEDAASH
jgi:tetratricopeptide (TPR) repeat protein